MQGVDCLPDFFIPTISLESNDDVAKIDEVSGKLSTLNKLVFVALTWLGAISVYLYIQHGDIQAIKQSIADHGLGQIVAELKAPKSPEQLQANLTTVIAQVQTARVNGTKPDEKNVYTLSGALSEVVQHNPELPEAWQAATVLVSYRSGTPAASQDNCFGQNATFYSRGMIWQPNTNGTNTVEIIPDTVAYSNCTFDLSDVEGFNNTYIKEFREKGNGTTVPLVIQLINSHLVYHGGVAIPFTTLQCKACTYDFDSTKPPPFRVQELTRKLLLAINYADISVDVHGAV